MVIPPSPERPGRAESGYQRKGAPDRLCKRGQTGANVQRKSSGTQRRVAPAASATMPPRSEPPAAVPLTAEPSDRAAEHEATAPRGNGAQCRPGPPERESCPSGRGRGRTHREVRGGPLRRLGGPRGVTQFASIAAGRTSSEDWRRGDYRGCGGEPFRRNGWRRLAQRGQAASSNSSAPRRRFATSLKAGATTGAPPEAPLQLRQVTPWEL